MGNGIYEARKTKNNLGEYAPDPPKASRLRRLFHYAFLCVPKRKNHATPLRSIAEQAMEWLKEWIPNRTLYQTGS